MERKVKYNYEFKLRCVEEVLKKQRGIGTVAIENGLHKTCLRKWINFYCKYGSEGLLPRQNRSYDVGFKLKVLRAIDKKCLSLSEACVTFNIPSSSVITSWQRRFNADGTSGLRNKPKGRPPSMTYKRAKRKSDKPLTREEELLLEIDSLRAENELLKKLQALIQAEEANQSKKRKP